MSYLTGDLQFSFILSAFIYFAISVSIVKIIRLRNKDKDGGARGGRNFSFKFWIKDNWEGVVLHFLIATLTIRFTSDMIHYFGIEVLGTEDPMWIYVVFGLLAQTVIDKIQKLIRK